MEWAKWPENVLLKLGAHQFNVIMRKAAAVATTATARSRKGWPIHDTWIHVKHPAEHGPVLLECLRVWAVLLCEWRNDTIKIQIKTKAAFSLHDRSNGPSEHSACIQEENQPWWVSLYLSFCYCCCFKQWTATENAGKKIQLQMMWRQNSQHKTWNHSSPIAHTYPHDLSVCCPPGRKHRKIEQFELPTCGANVASTPLHCIALQWVQCK